MRLSTLLAALPPELSPTATRSGGDADPVIRGIAYDSRAVVPGDLFVALRGATSDGHAYIGQALDLGATALLVEEAPAQAPGPIVTVPDSRRAMAPIAIRFYGEPARELQLIGVTGTNGKTSTTYLLESILSRGGARVGLVGTVEIRYAGERQRSVNTTPESLDLQRTLRAMVNHNIDTAVMEVSSHGLELGRVSGCEFSVAAVTNLTQDHLDFHGDMAKYRDAKTLLFRNYLAREAHAVVNLDDASAEAFIEAARSAGARVLGTTRDAGRTADLVLLETRGGLQGTRARVRTPRGELALELPLIGDFNLENMMVACGVAEALEIPLAAIEAGVASCPQVPGRMELVDEPRAGEPTVIVDYAHTPDAVTKLLAAVRPLAEGRIITVFGCGGDRDRAKRPLMAEAVAACSDRVIATSDNPRTEDPDAILRDVEAGLKALQRVGVEALSTTESGYVVIADRRAAIQAATACARPNDTIVIAGKGHEDYQIVGTTKLPFDDRAEARRALALRGAG